MSEDLIRRSDAIDAFKKELTVGESKGNYVTICSAVGYEGARQILESLPSAQRWIPCDTDLPGYGEDVLISISGYCAVGHIVSTNDEERYNWYYSGWYHNPSDVDAWMSLPEPWKGEADDTN